MKTTSTRELSAKTRPKRKNKAEKQKTFNIFYGKTHSDSAGLPCWKLFTYVYKSSALL